MTLELAHGLIVSEVVSARAVARGLFLATTQEMPFVQTLLATGAIDEAKLEEATKDADEALTTLTPSLSLVQRLPRGLCARLLIVPIGRDEAAGTVDIAMLDPRDAHAVSEASFFLQAPVKVHRATVAALRAAIEQVQRADASAPAEVPQAERIRTPIWGTPVVSVVPPPAPHSSPADMPIPLMRRSSVPAAQRKEESAVLELRTPASARPTPEPDTQREPDPVFALKPAQSTRRPALLMIADAQIHDAPTKVHAAVTIPAPKEDPRHTMVTAPAPARRSEAPPSITMPRQTRVPAAPRSLAPSMSAQRLPLPDAEPVLAAMQEANDRDAIVALLISGMQTCARRVAIMAVKRDSFVGWSCNAEFGDARVWRSVQIPSNVPSVLATAASGTSYLGPLFRTDGHDAILAFMKDATRDVAVTGVRVDMHPVLILVADDLADTALGTKRLDQLAKAATVALARVLRKPVPR